MDPFKDLKKKFSYKAIGFDTPRALKQRSQITKSLYRKGKVLTKTIHEKDDLPHLKPLLEHGLKLLFIGYNPSIRTAQTGHVFNHPTNSFWRLIYESGVVNTKLEPKDDVTMPKKYSIGFTSLVHRPTRGISDLTQEEMRHAVPELLDSIRSYDPKVICLVGKGIWDHITKNLGIKGDFAWGEQKVKQLKCRVYVVPSTSGLVRISKTEQLEIWKGLKQILDHEAKSNVDK